MLHKGVHFWCRQYQSEREAQSENRDPRTIYGVEVCCARKGGAAAAAAAADDSKVSGGKSKSLL